MQIFSIIAGGVLLLAGRRLFWLFVGAVGFFVGMNFAGQFLPENATFITSIIIGLIAAVLAVFLQRAGLMVAGFLAGGYLLAYVVDLIAPNAAVGGWLPFIVGGILGIALISTIFDWALILLSAFIGAVLVAQGFQLGQPGSLLLIIVLVIVGIAAQAGFGRKTSE